jgi:hypothetical protein
MSRKHWRTCFLIAALVSYSEAVLPNIARGIRNKREEEGEIFREGVVPNVAIDYKIYVFLKEVMPNDLWFILDPANTNSDIKTKPRWTDNEIVSGNCRDLITPKSMLVEEWVQTSDGNGPFFAEINVYQSFIGRTWAIPVSTENNSFIRTEAKCIGCSPKRYPGSPFYLVSRTPSSEEVIIFGKCDYCQLSACLSTCPNGMVSPLSFYA